MKFFIATNNYVVKGTVREYLKKQFPMVEIFDVININSNIPWGCCGGCL